MGKLNWFYFRVPIVLPLLTHCLIETHLEVVKPFLKKHLGVLETRAQGLKGAHLGTMFNDLRRFFKKFPSLKLISPRAGLL